MMNLLEVIVLGIVQGLTEFIPISSSGHLVIAQALFGHESSHLFLEAINVGTFLALLIYFFPKIKKITKDITVKHDYRLLRNVLLTAVPAGIIGYAGANFIETTAFFSSIVTVMVTLFVVGVVMVVLERLPKLSNVVSGTMLSGKRALFIGVAQMTALIPGVSRSGSTIIAGRLAGLSAKEAAEYSFLASLPIMAAVTLKVFLSDSDYIVANMGSLIIGNIAALISGLLAVSFLMRYLSTHSLAVFGWYRIGLAAVIAVVLLIQFVRS